MRGTADRQTDDDNVDVSFKEREENPRDAAVNQTQDLPNTSQTPLPPNHWTHGRGKEASLLMTARLEASARFRL